MNKLTEIRDKIDKLTKAAKAAEAKWHKEAMALTADDWAKNAKDLPQRTRDCVLSIVWWDFIANTNKETHPAFKTALAANLTVDLETLKQGMMTVGYPESMLKARLGRSQVPEAHRT